MKKNTTKNSSTNLSYKFLTVIFLICLFTGQQVDSASIPDNCSFVTYTETTFGSSNPKSETYSGNYPGNNLFHRTVDVYQCKAPDGIGVLSTRKFSASEWEPRNKGYKHNYEPVYKK